MSVTVLNTRSGRYNSVAAFELGGHLMAVPTDILREILEPPAITRVPKADRMATGLMNVRGVVTPVAELRPLLSLPAQASDKHTRVLVLDFRIADASVTVGLIVDKVLAVIALDPSALRPAPSVGTQWPANSMACVGRWQDRPVYVPDVETIFRSRVEQFSKRASQTSDAGGDHDE